MGGEADDPGDDDGRELHVTVIALVGPADLPARLLVRRADRGEEVTALLDQHAARVIAAATAHLLIPAHGTTPLARWLPHHLPVRVRRDARGELVFTGLDLDQG
ncbi:hypothetical protein ACIRBX_24715 [Kitasatospora sp. NPDC096147]|uniref:hypothetical protein n=1 Tax=Kitasatospora sp. NPDC096147 TaxID=3364093 RepID=UPI003817364F